jgi:hypothetical protein
MSDWMSLLFDCRSHPLFKRQMRIKQLGVLPFIGCTFNYTRWTHAMAVGATAALVTRRTNTFGSMMGVAFELAASFHDIGHHVFSHSFDNFLDKLQLPHDTHPRHEERSMAILEVVVREVVGATTQPAEYVLNNIDAFIALAQGYICPYGPLCSASKNAVENPLAFLLHSDECDIDRIDYVSRDRKLIGLGPVWPSVSQVLSELRLCSEGSRTYVYQFHGPLSDMIIQTRNKLHARVFSLVKNYDEFLFSFFNKLELQKYCDMRDPAARAVFLKYNDDNLFEIIDWYTSNIQPLCLEPPAVLQKHTLH